jgi:hypothetical protein
VVKFRPAQYPSAPLNREPALLCSSDWARRGEPARPQAICRLCIATHDQVESVARVLPTQPVRVRRKQRHETPAVGPGIVHADADFQPLCDVCTRGALAEEQKVSLLLLH